MPKYKGHRIKGFWFWMFYCSGLGAVSSAIGRNIILLPSAIVIGLFALKWMLDKEIELLELVNNA